MEHETICNGGRLFNLSVPEADNHPQLKVYPNPARTFNKITPKVPRDRTRFSGQ